LSTPSGQPAQQSHDKHADTPIPLAKGPEVLDAPRPPRESRLTKVVVAVLGGALLFAPWVAGAAGARSDPVPGENRALAPTPKLHGFKTFSDLTAYAADHFPLRDVAIRDNKKLVQQLFGEDPSYAGNAVKPQVLQGKDGWLYFMDDYNKACSPEIPLTQVLAGVKRLNSMLRAAGKRLVLVVPPDKSTADPQFLPANFDLKSCGEKAKKARYAALASLGVDGYVDLLGPIRAQEKATGEPAFLPFDTHWTQRTAATFVQQVAAKLDPALATGTSVVKTPGADNNPFKEQGDLQVLNGNAALFSEQGYTVARQGVVNPPSQCDEYGPKAGAYSVNHFTGTTTGPAQLFQPRTTWIGDSFTQRALPKIWPYFRDVTRVPELTKAIAAGSDVKGRQVYPMAVSRMLYEMSHSDVVVVELVERTFAGVGGYGTMWSPSFLDAVQAALTTPPASFPAVVKGASCNPLDPQWK
jgi:alginate O-acetyltransferase complex protein AlgJ